MAALLPFGECTDAGTVITLDGIPAQKAAAELRADGEMGGHDEKHKDQHCEQKR
jgi:hypothetical protein